MIYTKHQLEEKKVEFPSSDDYLRFLIKEAIKKRKDEIINQKRHKVLAFNDKTNCLILPDPTFTTLKNLENENFYILIPGNFTRDKDTLIKVLELYLQDRAYPLKGKFEYLGLFSENIPNLIMKKLIEILPVFYYNTTYKFGLTPSAFSLSLNEKDFILKSIKPEDLEDENFKLELLDFMEYFRLKFLIRKGQKPFSIKIDKNHYLISLGDNVALIDTEIKIFERRAFLSL